eukprot:scaffold2773_cov410-Prasinococcus_capsulatus_cf.AAC.10
MPSPPVQPVQPVRDPVELSSGNPIADHLRGPSRDRLWIGAVIIIIMIVARQAQLGVLAGGGARGRRLLQRERGGRRGSQDTFQGGTRRVQPRGEAALPWGAQPEGGMGRGKYKKGPTGRRHFSSPEELAAADAGESAAKDKGTTRRKDVSDSDDDEGDTVKTKGVEGLIEVSNPNVQRKQHVKVSDLEEAAQPELSRREREEIEKQRAKVCRFPQAFRRTACRLRETGSVLLA